MFPFLLNSLSTRVTLILILAFSLSQVGMFQKIIFKKNLNNKDKFILSIVFGVIGIIGTYTGLEINGAFVNARVIGVAVGGLLGGPAVGISSGLIAGVHRYLLDPTGFSTIACSIATVLEGFLAGRLKNKFDNINSKISFAFFVGLIGEAMQMLLILIIAKPFNEAVKLVSIIAGPMLIANALGIAAFIFIIESFFKEIEREAATQAQAALKIANKTIKYFRRGYNKEIAEEVATIIKDNLNIDAVSLTDKEKILTHLGAGDDHHTYGISLQTQVTKEVIDKGNCRQSNTQKDIGCVQNDCPLKSAIIVPLYDSNEVIGTLKLYKTQENGITNVEREIAIGLAKIFSTQIELSKIDKQKEMLTRAELKMLQAQINPHFLFNAINTISSLIRINPNKARSLLIHLGNYFRNNLGSDFSDITLEEEMKNINSYMEIEKARFEDKLEIIIDIPEDIDCMLPPLIIQPLAENAVKHGILSTIEGGIIKISAKNFGDRTKITVEDNGAGMEKDFISKLLNEELDEDKIGVKNVHNRLINKYGSNFGLKFESQLGVGTKVEVIIPKI